MQAMKPMLQSITMQWRVGLMLAAEQLRAAVRSPML